MEHAAPRGSRTAPAEPGSLAPEVAVDMRILDDFLRNRDRAIAGLMGRQAKPSPARDALIRQIILHFAEGRIERIATYQRDARPPATKTGIRRDIDLLAAVGLVLRQPDPADSRAVLVVPTARLVSFYNDVMPRLAAEVQRLFPAIARTRAGG